jgi:hypothetical protein
LAAEFDSRLGYVLTKEKADAMRRALAFVYAVRKEQWGDASELLHSMIDGWDNKTPITNFCEAMGVMATLLCNEVDVTDEWVQKRIAGINWLEAHPDQNPDDLI